MHDFLSNWYFGTLKHQNDSDTLYPNMSEFKNRLGGLRLLLEFICVDTLYLQRMVQKWISV
jgi:hypothetical protein